MTRESRPGEQYHGRRNSLTEDDINDILMAFEKRQTQIPHICRFEGITTEDFYESVKFFKHMNASFVSGKSVVGKTLLVLAITFIFGATGVGIATLIFSKMKGP